METAVRQMDAMHRYDPDLGCSARIRVRYCETDAMGIVHHANYLCWFEVARTEYLRAAGIPYSSLEARGLGSPLTGSSCRYLKPSRYDDQLIIQTWISRFNGVRLTLSYLVWLDGQPICTGETDHAFVMAGRPVALHRSMPDVFFSMRSSFEKDQACLLNKPADC